MTALHPISSGFALIVLISLVSRHCFAEEPAPPGMGFIPAGEFVMGTEEREAWATERPAHKVRVDGFWIDLNEVTNSQFAAFVKATAYVTTSERPVDWEAIKKQSPPGTPKPPDEKLKAGSLVFTPPTSSVPLNDMSDWWTWTTGASWRHPEGPSSNLDGRDAHPAVHISWDDATAYAKWAGKRLPTEAEWEYASRGGLNQKRFEWGDVEPTDTRPLCNIWQGDFPWKNTLTDGYLRTSPARTYKPNGYGLYDMGGNVWEWCNDFYRADEYTRVMEGTKATPLVNPIGPSNSWDPNDAVQTTPKHVIRGGSFLCHKSYCESYRPSARRGQTPDTGMSHLGFRWRSQAIPQKRIEALLVSTPRYSHRFPRTIATFILPSHAGVRKFSAAQLLVALALLLVALPFIDQLRYGKLVESVLLTLVYLCGVMAVGGSRRTLVIAIVLMVPAVIERWSHHFGADADARTFSTVAAIVFTAYLMAHLFRFILLASRVDSEVVCAGIAGYLLMGIIWAMIYVLMDKVNPNSFGSGGDAAITLLDGFDATCFSLGTLSTLGYGNVVPLSRPARMLPTLEAIIGMFYVAILISRLVAHYSGKDIDAGDVREKA